MPSFKSSFKSLGPSLKSSPKSLKRRLESDSSLFKRLESPSLLKSDYLQFGFKTGFSCNDAIFTLKSVCDYFNERGSTVNLCALDIAKAFDRVDQYALLTLLMKRCVPKFIISVLLDWFSKCKANVR